MVARFVNQARRLDTISRELEDEVDRRTRELADTQLALLQSEKLAALSSTVIPRPPLGVMVKPCTARAVSPPSTVIPSLARGGAM